MKKTAIFKDDLFLCHDPGFDHAESPERLRILYNELEKIEDDLCLYFPEVEGVGRTDITRNHTADHYERVAATAGKIYSVLEEDTFTSAKSFDAACLAVACGLRGVDDLMAGRYSNCFSLVRPPGHHAEPHKPMGYCLFNTIAIAARYAVEEYGLKRIAVVDWDVHHGNGTQRAFLDTDEILFISIHQSPLYPGTGSLSQTGVGAGEGFTINIPLPGAKGNEEYANIFNRIVSPVVKQYKPELILISAGFDGHECDMTSSMRLTAEGFAYMARTMIRLAEVACGGKIQFFLEGGYHLPGLRDSVFSVLAEMRGAPVGKFSPLEVDKVSRLAGESTYHPAIDRVRDIAKNYWKM